ncbi:hypothetical protein [Planococcus salinarum]|uniref:hypothetical protein n=1 Tax=Planococcus salinarum TaxID=622695 RepID=UPI000E3D98B2|nr:hypothetical protein [Planococcus salinarum]TAA72030.1 hypothetical protein D2909_08510 [Planococcus salinarum]
MQKMNIWVILSILAATAFLIFLFVPRENVPPPNTRVVLEHTYRTYIAPSCFQEADATNFLEESTLAQAKELEYPPHSDCTAEAFKSNNESRFTSILKEFGVIEKESEDW